ncbi:MAG: FGGY family carbohydrate kinase, partial [Actinomycetota bacterium]
MPGGEPLVVGIDSSTQSTKVEARRIGDGVVVATGRAPHPPTDPPVSEQDPRSWWDALRSACAQLGDVRRDVAAVAVAGQQHGLVLLGEDGEPLRPAVLWNDTTSADRAAQLVEALGAERWAETCGSVPGPAFTIAKLAHVLDLEPGIEDRAARIMLPHDHLTWRLCGRHVSDPGDASGTGWFDPVSGTHRTELLATAVRDPEAWLPRLPTVLASTDAAGSLVASAAGELGLPEGIPVAAGTGDNMAAAVGLGLAAGDVVISLGTSGTVYAVSDRPTADPTGAVAGFADATGRHLPLVCTLNATRVTDAVAR